MFKMIREGIDINERLKRRFYLLKLHGQLRNERYGKMIRIKCMAEIARLELLEEYLRTRKER